MAHNYPKWPKKDAQIYALFPQIFLTEKVVPQTFSLLECMAETCREMQRIAKSLSCFRNKSSRKNNPMNKGRMISFCKSRQNADIPFDFFMMIPTVFTASKGLEIFYSDIYCEYFRPLFYKSTTISYLLKSCQRPVPSAPMCRCPWFQTYEVSSSSSVCVCCNSNVSLPYGNQVT